MFPQLEVVSSETSSRGDKKTKNKNIVSHACLCENTEIESKGKKEKKRKEMKLLLLESALICQAVTKN